MAVTYTANLNVSMEQIFSGIQYTLLHEENGNEAVNPNAPSIQLSPYAIQIAGGWNTQVHEYGGPLSFNVERLAPGDSLTSDRYVLSNQNDLVIWDRETSDGSDYMFSTNVNPNDPPASFDSRYGLPGLTGGDNGAFSQTNAIEIFDLGAGNDVISLVYNNATVAGVAGVAYTGNVTVYGGTGFDVAWSGAGNDYLYGGDGADTLYGGAGNDTIEGGAGGNVDLLFGPDGFKGDLIDGGSGVNWVNYSGSAAAVHVILNNDQFGTATGTGGDAQGDIVRRVNNLIGSSAGNDTLQGNTSANTIIGLGGNDTIYGGDDAVGGDVIYGDDTPGAVNGNDSIFGGAGSDTVYGGLGNDFVEGSAGGDSLSGGAGNDTLSYSQSSAFVNVTLGGTGTNGDATGDSVAADFENLVGSAHDDFLVGDLNANFIFGGSGLDSIRGAAGTDTIYGGAGIDTIEGGVGADSLSGGGEGDWISYLNSTNGVFVNLDTSTAGNGGTVDDADGDIISGFTNIIGSNNVNGNDTLYGGATANTILGADGSDSILGLGGDDSIDGGGGNDTVIGGAGADTMYGGTGAGDWLSYAGSAAVIVNLGSASAQSGGDAGGDIISGFENLVGSSNADSLSGTNGANTIYGGQGVDTILGDAGADSLDGGGQGDWVSYLGSSGVTVDLSLATAQSGGHAAGDILAGFSNLIGSGQADFLTGTSGINTIFGGAGADSIVAGAGVDFVTGDGGDDTLSGGGDADSLDGGAGTGDWVSYASSAAPVTVNLSLATAQSGGDAQGDTLTGIENLLGSSGGDSLTGSNGANTIFGGLGVDTIEGGLGNDVLDGRTSLGAANEGDWLSYANASGAVSASFFGGTATGAAGTDTISGFQHLLGSANADFLEGDDDLDNSIVGGGGTDTLRGLGGIDTLFGGDANDLIQIGNNGGSFVPTTVSGWDGDAGSATINVSVAADVARVGDYAFGGNGVDTLDMASLTSGSARTLYMRLNPDGTPSSNSNISGFLAGIEIIVAGTAADIINLTFNDGVTRTAYAENISIFAGSGGDVVFSGSGNDLIVGGGQVTSTTRDGNDTLFGGQGNDTIVGDDLGGGEAGGDDTLFGGGGLDTLFGGAANDVLIDTSGGGSLSGDEGADLLVLDVVGPVNGVYVAHGGKDDALIDGADRVFAAGTYGTVNASLGADADVFISSSVDSGSAQVDRVSGDSGNDAISSWHGSDILDGGSGSDVIWGGAGADTIYGGDDSDYLYGGAGDGDVLVGGGGADYYYWARNDGDDTISDQDNDTISGDEGINYILVFAGFEDPTNPNDDLNGDAFIDGAGVVEIDGNLYDNDGNDMVQLTVDANDNTIYHLEVLTGVGMGSTLTFDRDEISIIALGNSDNGTMTLYQWVEDDLNPLGGSYKLI